MTPSAPLERRGKETSPEPLFPEAALMAIFHLHCDIIGRARSGGKLDGGGGKGARSAVAAAAYRARCSLKDEEQGRTFRYKKGGLLHSEIILPKGAPEWAADRGRLWNEVQKKESRKNSQFCRSFDIALPAEFTLDKNVELIKKWIAANYGDRGLAADLCVHAPHKREDGTDNKNYHAHVLVALRKFAGGEWGEKDREGNDKKFLVAARESWAEIVNEEFKRQGLPQRIDARSNEARGIQEQPQQHQGAAATAMERRGEEPRRKKKELDLFAYAAEAAKAAPPPEKKKARAPTFEEKAEAAFLVEAASGEDAKKIIERKKDEQVFHFVRDNEAAELAWWQSQKSDDWHDRGYNAGIDEKIAAARKIAHAPDFEAVRQTTAKYRADAFNPLHYDGGAHLLKFKKWLSATKNEAVKICGAVIEKFRSLRKKGLERTKKNFGHSY